MITKVYDFWQKILNLGVQSDTEFNDLKRIRILNGFSYLSVIFTFFNALWGFILDIPGLIILNYAVSIIMLLVMFSNKRGNFNLSKFLFFIILGIHIGIVETTFEVGAHFYIFPLFILAAFIIKNRTILYLYLVFILIIFLASESRIFPGLLISIDPDMASIIKINDGVLAIIFSIFGIDLFRKQYEHDRHVIMSKNKLLKDTAKVSNESAEYATLLLKEMNHRVKNNLQLISSLLNIHAAQLKDTTAKQAVLNAKQRISSIALIHRQLYKDNHSSTVDIGQYIEDLIPFIRESLLTNEDGVEINVNAQNFQLSVEDAVSIGLLINETLTNSIRHDLERTRKKQVSLDVKKSNQNTIQIIVQDSGSGIQKMISEENTGFGFELIKMLASNYDGKVIIDDSDNKITIDLHYKVYDLFSANMKMK